MQILGMGTDGLWKKLCMKAIDFMRERYFKGVLAAYLGSVVNYLNKHSN